MQPSGGVSRDEGSPRTQALLQGAGCLGRGDWNKEKKIGSEAQRPLFLIRGEQVGPSRPYSLWALSSASSPYSKPKNFEEGAGYHIPASQPP